MLSDLIGGWMDVIVIRSNARSVVVNSPPSPQIPPINDFVTFLFVGCSLFESSCRGKMRSDQNAHSFQIFNRPSGEFIVLQAGEKFKRTFAGSSTRHRQRSSGHEAEPARSSAHPAAL